LAAAFSDRHRQQWRMPLRSVSKKARHLAHIFWYIVPPVTESVILIALPMVGVSLLMVVTSVYYSD
jgi:hypothetical protein